MKFWIIAAEVVSYKQFAWSGPTEGVHQKGIMSSHDEALRIITKSAEAPIAAG